MYECKPIQLPPTIERHVVITLPYRPRCYQLFNIDVNNRR